MREILITIAAVMLTGCIGASKTELLKDEKVKPIILPIESVAEADAKPESSTAKSPKISIHDAAAQGNNDAIKQHLSAGTDVNAKDESGWTPLHWAASKVHNKSAKLLIKAGADVNSATQDGFSPLRMAAMNVHHDVCRMLMKAGAVVT